MVFYALTLFPPLLHVLVKLNDHLKPTRVFKRWRHFVKDYIVSALGISLLSRNLWPQRVHCKSEVAKKLPLFLIEFLFEVDQVSNAHSMVYTLTSLPEVVAAWQSRDFPQNQ